MSQSPEGRALHDLYREFTETLRYSPDDPDLFERLTSDPRYERTHEYRYTEADREAEYQAGRDHGYADGRNDALDNARDLLRSRGYDEAADLL